MDEEDGRLGPQPGHNIGKVYTLPMDVTGSRAQQTGRVDALQDARTKSLCHLREHSYPQISGKPQVSIQRPARNQYPSKALIHREVNP
jgi:hypothetical protein